MPISMETADQLKEEHERIVNAFRDELTLYGFSALIVTGHEQLMANCVIAHDIKKQVGTDTKFDAVLPLMLDYDHLTYEETMLLKLISSRLMTRVTEKLRK